MEPRRIKKIRLNLGWSQEKMARKLGVSFSTVNRWERGRTKPSPLAVKSLETLDVINVNDTKGRRQALRLKAHCPVEVRLLGDATDISSLQDTPSFDVVTENLSATGLMFKTRVEVTTGKKLGVGWNIGDKRIETISEVVWIENGVREKTIGVSFDYPIPEVVTSIIDSMLGG